MTSVTNCSILGCKVKVSRRHKAHEWLTVKSLCMQCFSVESLWLKKAQPDPYLSAIVAND